MNVRCPQCETVYRVDPSKVPERGVRARCATCAAVILVADGTARRPSPVELRAAPPPDVAAPAARSKAPAPPEPIEQQETVATVAPETEPELVVPEPDLPVSETVIPEPPVEAVAAPPTPEPPVAVEPPPTAPLEEPATPEPDLVVPPPAPAPPAPTPRPRYSRPFIQPRQEAETAERTPGAPPRPTAPVFRPTPGMPLQSPTPAAPTQGAAPIAAGQPAVPRRRPINPFLSRDPTQKARRLARALVSDMIVYQPKKRQDALQAGTLKDEFEEEIRKSWEEFVQQVGEEVATSTDFFREALNDILAGGREVFEAGFKF